MFVCAMCAWMHGCMCVCVCVCVCETEPPPRTKRTPNGRGAGMQGTARLKMIRCIVVVSFCSSASANLYGLPDSKPGEWTCSSASDCMYPTCNNHPCSSRSSWCKNGVMEPRCWGSRKKCYLGSFYEPWWCPDPPPCAPGMHSPRGVDGPGSQKCTGTPCEPGEYGVAGAMSASAASCSKCSPGKSLHSAIPLMSVCPALAHR